MTRPASRAGQTDIDAVLKRLEEAKLALVYTLEQSPEGQFEATDGEGTSIKYALERTVDDLNFYYGRLAARALNLPQPPCMVRADFGSLREGVAALHEAHRGFSNLLHDLLPADLEKSANDIELGSFTLRQILELAAAHYAMRTQQVQRLAHAAPDPLQS